MTRHGIPRESVYAMTGVLELLCTRILEDVGHVAVREGRTGRGECKDPELSYCLFRSIFWVGIVADSTCRV